MQVEQIRNLLPAVYRRTWRPGSPLDALLASMAALLGPAEQAIQDFPRYLDPRLTPDQFVPLLARWVDLTHLFEARLRGRDVSVHGLMPTGLGRLRELIANAAYLSRWRGTSHGLTTYLQIATGLDGFEVDENFDRDSRPRRFHICVRGPAEAEPHRALIEEIIRSEKPAHLTFEFVTGKRDHRHGDND